MKRFAIRPATVSDIAVLSETVQQGFEGYRAFLPPGWDPPAEEFEHARISERLALDDTWCRIAFDGDEPAGHVAFLAARDSSVESRPVIPGLAHLWMLFIREPWWGSGLAPHLLSLAEATAGGYATMRLFTPAGQARARRFYEREGFAWDGIVRPEPMLGFDLVEYRREL